MGAGLGYHLEPLAKLIDSYYKIIVIDPLAEAEEILKINPNLDFLFISKKFHLISGADTKKTKSILTDLIDLDLIKGIATVELPQSVRLFPKFFKSVSSAVSSLIDSKGSNTATIKKFSTRLALNAAANLGSLKIFYPTSSLFNKFKGYPAALIASGPSLDKYIETIKSAQQSIFILCVDSAVQPLVRSGINPDIVISIDPQPHIAEHFASEKLEDALKVFSVNSYPPISKKLGGFLSLNSHPLAQAAEQISRTDIGSIDSRTGSVAGDALALALKCGFSEIFLFGFDFSFIDFSIYARGTAYQNRYSIYLNNRFSTAETKNLNYIMKSSRAHKKEGRFTRKVFLNYKIKLEEFIQSSGARNIFNFNAYGLVTAGAEAAGDDSLLTKLKPIDKNAFTRKITAKLKPMSESISPGQINRLIDSPDIIGELAEKSGCADKNKKFRRILNLMRG